MTITALHGPVIAFGSTNPSGTYNSDRSPSMFDQGTALMDPRSQFCYLPGGATSGQGTRGAYGWLGVNNIVLVDQVPSTLTTTAIAAAQVPVAGTAMTLVAATGAGITAGASVVNAATGLTVTGLLAIDGAFGFVQPGGQGGNFLWDPTKAIARAVSIASAGDDSAGTFKVVGYDIYGFPMSEVITGANTTTATGKKAFKYVQSITPAGTLSGSNASAGQSDVIGFMLRSDRFQYIQIYWPDTTLISASTGYTAAVTTSPATTTTGDVRGTYSLQGSASNNTRRLIITAKLQLANISTQTGLVGVTQV